MKRITKLMQKEMTRKEFLTTAGFGLATLFGFSAILKLLTGRDNPLQKQDIGYGGGAYGGRED
jgi:hypothetical protein